jgi:hypothetical protein
MTRPFQNGSGSTPSALTFRDQGRVETGLVGRPFGVPRMRRIE